MRIWNIMFVMMTRPRRMDGPSLSHSFSKIPDGRDDDKVGGQLMEDALVDGNTPGEDDEGDGREEEEEEDYPEGFVAE